jgi:ketosteroid isomerase-like protein
MSSAPGTSAIVAVMHEYAFALDERRWEALRDVFTEDARADFGPLGGVRDGVDAIARFCERALGAFAVTQHLIGTVAVERDGDAASSRSYVLATHVRPGEPDFTLGGRYTDTLARRPTGWRITSRRLETMWSRGGPA